MFLRLCKASTHLLLLAMHEEKYSNDGDKGKVRKVKKQEREKSECGGCVYVCTYMCQGKTG